MTRFEWALLVLLSLLWGGSFFFVELVLDGLAPVTVVLGRVGLAAFALLVLVRLRGRSMPAEPKVWLAFFVMGALNNAVPFTLIVWGQTHIDSGLAAILNATTPLFTVLLAPMVTRGEPLGGYRLAGVLLGLCGVAVLVGPEVLNELGGQALAQLAVLLAAVSYACAGHYGRRLTAMEPMVAAAGMLTASTLWTLPFALVLESPWDARPGLGVWAALLALALLSTAAAYPIYFRVLRSAGPTNLLLVTFLIPLSALGLGTAFLGERPGWDSLAGMALIFAGLAAVDGRLLRRCPFVRHHTIPASRKRAISSGSRSSISCRTSSVCWPRRGGGRR